MTDQERAREIVKRSPYYRIREGDPVCRIEHDIATAQAVRIAELERDKIDLLDTCHAMLVAAGFTSPHDWHGEGLPPDWQGYAKMSDAIRAKRLAAEAERDRLRGVIYRNCDPMAASPEDAEVIMGVARRQWAALNPAPQKPCPTCGGVGEISEMGPYIGAPCPDCQEKPHG